MENAWNRFEKSLKSMGALRSASALLEWDQETYMPEKSGEARSEILEDLARRGHRDLTSATFAEQFEAASASAGGDSTKCDLLREVRRDMDQAKRIPEDLQGKLVASCSLAQQAWASARQRGDCTHYLPLLSELIDLKKEEAACLNPGKNPYDALLDQFESGMNIVGLDKILLPLESSLKNMLENILSRQEKKVVQNSGPFPAEKQKKLCLDLLNTIGFDLAAGRLDLSAHPFTQGMHSQDVRLTVRFCEDDLSEAISAALHEGGHGLYEQGLSYSRRFTPAGEAVSLGVHESQSRLWENHVGRSPEFWEFYWPKLLKIFPKPGASSASKFLKKLNWVEPGPIRVDADEVCYNLHVSLRYRIEKAIFSGELSTGDIEAEWNRLSQELLGVTPENPFQGWLQDVHWSFGLFGYFPTYALGNLYAAQLFHAVQQRRANEGESLENDIRQGDFGFLRTFLRENIHDHGRNHNPAELILQSTGHTPDSRFFIDYLERKYLP